LALVAIWVIHVFWSIWYWQIRIGQPLEKELGFRIGTPVIQEDGSSWPTEVLSIESLEWDGAFTKAGFQRGDVIRGVSLNELFKALHRGRGKSVTIRVVDGGDGPPLDQRAERTITITVPAL
jgi:hypothetical protein